MVWRTLNILMGALFVFAAALQYNDPQPVRWMAIYLVASLPCWLALADRIPRALPVIVGAVGLVWAATYLVRGVPTVAPSHMFDEWEMKNQQVLETRELFGLLIVVAWMLVLTGAAVIARRERAAV